MTDGLAFGHDARYDLPVLMITAEYDEAQLREWTEAGESGTEEIARLRALRYADLHSGHWPQFTRVDDTVRLDHRVRGRPVTARRAGQSPTRNSPSARAGVRRDRQHLVARLERGRCR